jgi:hypothetical protein
VNRAWDEFYFKLLLLDYMLSRVGVSVAHVDSFSKGSSISVAVLSSFSVCNYAVLMLTFSTN